MYKRQLLGQLSYKILDALLAVSDQICKYCPLQSCPSPSAHMLFSVVDFSQGSLLIWRYVFLNKQTFSWIMMQFLIFIVVQMLAYRIARGGVLQTPGCKKEMESEGASQGWILFRAPCGLFSNAGRWREKVWGRIRFPFTMRPTFLVTTFVNWDKEKVFQKKIEKHCS